jgi:RNA polymerase sigma-70 factor (sigma-E family)
MTDVSVGERAAQPLGALGELYERHAAGAVRLAYLLTGDREVARDLAQDAFVKVAGRFRHARFPDAFEAYLRRTVVNLSTSRFRRLALERAYLDRERGARQVTVDAPDLGEREVLRDALERLPARQRAAVVLRYYEDLSERAMADALGCSVPAARSLLLRGMQALRTTVEDER